MSITIERSGPFFDGRAQRQVELFCGDWERRTATLGAASIRSEQHLMYRKETPHARFQTEARPTPPGWIIWQQKLVYRFWLEGTGKRNKTTRFKGYFIWRRMFPVIRERGYRLAHAIIPGYMGGMN